MVLLELGLINDGSGTFRIRPNAKVSTKFEDFAHSRKRIHLSVQVIILENRNHHREIDCSCSLKLVTAAVNGISLGQVERLPSALAVAGYR